MERHVTSEEKLLKLIRKQDKPRSAPAATPGKTGKGPNDLLSRGSTVALLKWCNRILLVAVLFGTGMLIYRYLEFRSATDIMPGSERVSSEKDQQFNAVWFTNIGESEPFLSQATVRDIFESPWERVQPPTPEEQQQQNIGPELKTMIRIAGIVIDQTNSQVIVEDLAGGQTVFLSKGQDIRGARLVEISEEKAVFIYNNERIELTP